MKTIRLNEAQKLQIVDDFTRQIEETELSVIEVESCIDENTCYGLIYVNRTMDDMHHTINGRAEYAGTCVKHNYRLVSLWCFDDNDDEMEIVELDGIKQHIENML